MGIECINPKKALNTVFYKLPVLESEIQKLSKNLGIYINSAKEGESEENHKNLIKDFLANTWYSPSYSVNTNGREDLVIFNGLVRYRLDLRRSDGLSVGRWKSLL